jgi:hypothetical protein
MNSRALTHPSKLLPSHVSTLLPHTVEVLGLLSSHGEPSGLRTQPVGEQFAHCSSSIGKVYVDDPNCGPVGTVYGYKECKPQQYELHLLPTWNG